VPQLQSCRRIQRNFFRGLFKFILGFTGTSVVPRIVMLAVLQFLRLTFMYNDPLWDSLTQSFLDHRLLTHSPVVLVYTDESTGSNVIARQLVYSVPQARPWGLLPRCGHPTCNAPPGSLRVIGGKKQNENHPKFKLKCNQCGWSSEYVPRPAWIQPLPKKFYFWHHFPLLPHELDYFNSESSRIVAQKGDAMEE
jgi:hypothetical protein